MRQVRQRERLSTRDHWNAFFQEGGPWERNNGLRQTRLFAGAFCTHTRIPVERVRSLLDSSCALGDALPVLRRRFPNAQLHACDFSRTAIDRGKKRFPGLASFFLASIDEIDGMYDVIYSSATLEHLTDYQEKARTLLRHCQYLCILVPFNERHFGKDLEDNPYCDHVVTFREHSFDFLLETGDAQKILRPQIVSVPKAWSWSARDWIVQGTKNVARYLLKRSLARNRKMILYEIERADSPGFTHQNSDGVHCSYGADAPAVLWNAETGKKR